MEHMTFDFSGMLRVEQIDGQLLAYSSDGAFRVPSYIVLRRGRRIYGRYNYQTARYEESPA